MILVGNLSRLVILGVEFSAACNAGGELIAACDTWCGGELIATCDTWRGIDRGLWYLVENSSRLVRLGGEKNVQPFARFFFCLRFNFILFFESC